MHKCLGILCASLIFCAALSESIGLVIAVSSALASLRVPDGTGREGVEMKERGQRLSRTTEDQGTCQPLNSLDVVS